MGTISIVLKSWFGLSTCDSIGECKERIENCLGVRVEDILRVELHSPYRFTIFVTGQGHLKTMDFEAHPSDVTYLADHVIEVNPSIRVSVNPESWVYSTGRYIHSHSFTRVPPKHSRRNAG